MTGILNLKVGGEDSAVFELSREEGQCSRDETWMKARSLGSTCLKAKQRGGGSSRTTEWEPLGGELNASYSIHSIAQSWLKWKVFW